MRQISDQQLAELLARRLRGARAFSLYLRKLGPGDVVYGAALGFDADDRIVEAKSSTTTLEQTLLQLLRNLDQATAPKE